MNSGKIDSGEAHMPIILAALRAYRWLPALTVWEFPMLEVRANDLNDSDHEVLAARLPCLREEYEGASAMVARIDAALAALATTSSPDASPDSGEADNVIDHARNVVAEFIECARLRGDNDLPHPCDDAKLWTARMIEAWAELEALADEDPLAALATTSSPDASPDSGAGDDLAREISRVAGCQLGSDRTRRLVNFIRERDARIAASPASLSGKVHHEGRIN